MVYALLSWRRHLHKIWEIVKYEYCTVMKFIYEFMKKKTVCQQLSWTFDKCLRGQCCIICNYRQMGRWIERGWTSLEDDPQLDGQLRWPRMIVAMLLKYWWREIDEWGPADSQGSGYFVRSILNILHDHPGLGKVCEDGLRVFWRHFRSHLGWKRVQNCWLSTVPTQTTFCPTM